MRKDIVGMPRAMQEVPDDCLMFNCEHTRCICGHDMCQHDTNNSCTECVGIDYGGCFRFEAAKCVECAGPSA